MPTATFRYTPISAAWARPGLASGVSRLPAGEDLINALPHAIARLESRYAGHEEFVVVGVLVAHRGDDGRGDGAFIERAAGCRAADPAAAADPSVRRDRGGPRRRATREASPDLLGQYRHELDV